MNEKEISQTNENFQRQYNKLKKDIKKINYKGLILKENSYSERIFFSFSKKGDIHILANLWSDGEKSYLEFSSGIIGVEYSLYYLCKKDTKFMHQWKNYKNILLKKHPRCEYCNQEFKEKNFAILHHKTDWRKEVIKKVGEIKEKVLNGSLNLNEAIEEYNQIQEGNIQRYKSFEDTCLICKKCHYLKHKKQIDAWKL
jgi:hypothetical protein